MKKFFSAALAISLVLMLTGCYPGNQKTSVTDGSTTIGVRHIKSEDDSIILDLDLPDTPDEISSIKLTSKTWDKEKIKEIFFDGKNVEEKETKSDVGINEKKYVFEIKDQLELYLSPGYIYFTDTAAFNGKLCYRFANYSQLYEGECDSDFEDLSAFSSDEAVKRVKSLLEELGITNLGEPLIKPIRAEDAQAAVDSVRKAFEGTTDSDDDDPFYNTDFTPWTENDEVYVVQFPLLYENVPLEDTGVVIQQEAWATTGSYIAATVSKDKVLQLHGDGIYATDYETVENIPVNYNAEQTLEKLKEFHSNIIKAPVTYKKCKLVYIPQKTEDNHMTFYYKPAWLFEGTRFGGIYTQRSYQYFFTDTGIRLIQE